jgi:predicted nucleotidyltransferase
MTIRVAAIEVSHWHALNDAAYLCHLVAMPAEELVALQDFDAGLVARRAADVGSSQSFTELRARGPAPMKPSASRIERMLEKVEATLVPLAAPALAPAASADTAPSATNYRSPLR